MAETDKSKHVGKTYLANNEMVAANRMAFQIYLFANYFDQYDSTLWKRPTNRLTFLLGHPIKIPLGLVNTNI